MGLSMICCSIWQAAAQRPSQASEYAKHGCGAMMLNALVFVSGGIYGAYFGTNSPPLLAFSLLNNFARAEILAVNRVHSFGFNL